MTKSDILERLKVLSAICALQPGTPNWDDEVHFSNAILARVCRYTESSPKSNLRDYLIDAEKFTLLWQVRHKHQETLELMTFAKEHGYVRTDDLLKAYESIIEKA